MVCLQTESKNTQGKLQNIFMQMKHLGDLGFCFHIVTITICSFLTALSILLCWRFGNHYEKCKLPLDTEMYELRKTYFRVNPSRANISWKSRKRKSWNNFEFLKTSIGENWQNWMAKISNELLRSWRQFTSSFGGYEKSQELIFCLFYWSAKCNSWKFFSLSWNLILEQWKR